MFASGTCLATSIAVATFIVMAYSMRIAQVDLQLKQLKENYKIGKNFKYRKSVEYGTRKIDKIIYLTKLTTKMQR
jgi:hypothetical protein